MSVAMLEQRNDQPRPSTERRPGCTDACRLALAYVLGEAGRYEVRLHDAAAHEAFGAQHAGDTRIVRTGVLVVDLGTSRAYVEGQEIRLPQNEWAILEMLAQNPDSVCSHAQILTEIWGAHPDVGSNHMLRVSVARLRHRLGSASPLISNRPGNGYLLTMAPPIAVALTPLPLSARPGWARNWDACRACHSTERAHQGHGLCFRCARRLRRSANAERHLPAAAHVSGAEDTPGAENDREV